MTTSYKRLAARNDQAMRLMIQSKQSTVIHLDDIGMMYIQEGNQATIALHTAMDNTFPDAINTNGGNRCAFGSSHNNPTCVRSIRSWFLDAGCDKGLSDRPCLPAYSQITFEQTLIICNVCFIQIDGQQLLTRCDGGIQLIPPLPRRHHLVRLKKIMHLFSKTGNRQRSPFWGLFPNVWLCDK